MAEYQFVEKDGSIINDEYDKATYFNCEQVKQCIENAFSLFPYEVEVDQVEGYEDVYKVTCSQSMDFDEVFICAKGTTPGGRSNLKDEQRIQPKAKYLNYVATKKEEGKKAIFMGIYTRDDAVIFCAWNVCHSDAASTETPISKQIKINSISKAMKEGFVQQDKGSGVYACAFKPEFLYFYLRNCDWLHTGHVTEISEHIPQEITPANITKGENILLYGVPGCGKSHAIKTVYNPSDDNMERVVFHPDYTYSDFVGQIMPKSKGGNIDYPFIPGPFTRILDKANAEGNQDSMFYLVIEEINRGNAPAIFGDIFQLLDRNDFGESEYGISNSDIAKIVYGDENRKVKIPSNLTILATMNTSDQNVFTLDTAFKRRWKMESIKNDIDGCDHAEKYVCGTSVMWKDFANTINDKIIELGTGSLSNEDSRLGAYFIKEDALYDAKTFAEKVLMYLWNDAFKYDRDKVFDSDYKTLDKLIDGFMESKLDVFILNFPETPSSADGSTTKVGE